VTLFDECAELEGATEWLDAAELDSTEAISAGAGTTPAWEFDAVAHRRKRQAALEKLESDRQAKRMKLAVRTPDAGRDDRSKRADEVPRRRTEEDRPRTATKEAARQATAPSATAPPAAGASPSPEATPMSTETAIQPAATAPTSAAESPVAALQGFLKDHPEFMRVLQNPKKCLSDPRVKSMFITTLGDYPIVKKFLASQGLNLN